MPLDHFVVGADGDRGEVDVPDRVVGGGHGGEGGVVHPFAVDGLDQQRGQGEAHPAEDQPDQPLIQYGTVEIRSCFYCIYFEFYTTNLFIEFYAVRLDKDLYRCY